MAITKKKVLTADTADDITQDVVSPIVISPSVISQDIASQIADSTMVVTETGEAAKNPWFDYSTYMTHKLQRLQETDSTFTANRMFKIFAEKGFAGTDGAFAHFEKYGADEDISPNAHFDAEYYYRAKALDYYTKEKGLTEDQVLNNIDKYAMNIKGAVNNKGMNAWTHYIKYGTKEGIDPSADFDTSAYMQAKCDALNAAEPEGGHTWTLDEVYKAFKAHGFNALSHFYKYAGNGDDFEVADGVTADDKIPEAYKVENPIVEPSSQTSGNFTLTRDMDHWTGANGNEVVSGISGASDADTYTAGDSLIDSSTDDNDTLNLFISKAQDGLVSDSVTVTNIEQINIQHTQKNIQFTIDAGDITGAKQIMSKVGSGSEIALDNVQSLDTEVGLKGAGNLSVTYNDKLLTGASDEAHVLLDGAGVKGTTANPLANASVVDVSNDGNLEKVALSTTGNNYVQVNVGEATDVAITGDGTNALQFVGTGTGTFTVNASEATGAQTLDFSQQTRDENVTGSAQNDLFIFGQKLNNNDKVDGGEGEDVITTAMTTSVGSLAGVENMIVTGVTTGMTFDGTNVKDLATLTVDGEAAEATFKNMNTELTKLHLNTSTDQVNPAKTALLYRTAEGETEVQAESVQVLVGQENIDNQGQGSSQKFGDLELGNVTKATITSFADSDNTASVTNVLGAVTTSAVSDVAIATAANANLETGALTLTDATGLSLTAVADSTLTTTGALKMATVKTYTVTAEEGATVTTANTAIDADALTDFTLNVGKGATLSHAADIHKASSLANVDIEIGELATVTKIGAVNIGAVNIGAIDTELDGTKADIKTFTVNAGMLTNDLKMGDVTANSVEKADITLSDQASHTFEGSFNVNSMGTLNLTAGRGAIITESLTKDGAESNIDTINASGAGNITVKDIDFAKVNTVDASGLTGDFTLDLSGMTAAADTKTAITLGQGKNTITGDADNTEIYTFTNSTKVNAIINEFKGEHDKIDFSAFFGNNSPSLIGGDADAGSVTALAKQTTGEAVSLDNHVFFIDGVTHNDIDAVVTKINTLMTDLENNDGYSLTAGSHAVVLAGTNGDGENLTAYVLTGNNDNLVAVDTDANDIAVLGVVDAALTADNFVAV